MATGGQFMRSIDRGCDEYYDYCCTPCSADGKNVEAINLCVDCDEYFCFNCLQNHNRFGKMKMHQILDMAGMKTRGPQQAPSPPTEKCSLHHGNIMDTYCPTDDAVCCSTCVSLDHSSCHMAYLPTAAKGIRKSKEYKHIKSSIQNIQLQLNKMKKAKQDELKTLEREKNNVLTQIKDFRKRMMARLDELEKIATDELQAKHQAFQDKINAEIKSMEDVLTSLDTNRKKLETCPGDNESQLFVFVKTGKKNETDGSKLLQEMAESPEKRSLKFSINLNIEDYMKSQKSLGDFLEDENLYSASLHGNYNVTVKNDKLKCLITVSCMLENGTLLLVDSNNHELKRLDQSYHLIDYCDLPDTPYAVCATGQQEVAITLLNQKKVQLVSVGDKMTLTRSFSVECSKDCLGIAYTNDQLFVFCRPEGIRVYSKSGGTLLKTVQQDSLGQNMFSNARQIALNSDSTKMHIADITSGVITLGIHGSKQFQFTDPELVSANGVCVGNNDEIFVCGYASNKIIQIGRDGRKLGVVLGEADGIKRPISLCWDRANSRLIVTMFEAGIIKVFDMKKRK